MSGFDASDVALRAAGYQLGVVVEGLDTEFAAVRAIMDSLLDGGWSGSAATSFGLGWQEWVRGYADATAALRGMGQALTATGTNYAGAESYSFDAVRRAGAGVS